LPRRGRPAIEAAGPPPPPRSRRGSRCGCCPARQSALPAALDTPKLADGAPIIIVQPGAAYGPGDHSEIGAIVDQAMRGKLPFVSFGGTGIVMCHVDDIADGMLLAHDKGAIGRTYVLGGEVTTLREINKVTFVE